MLARSSGLVVLCGPAGVGKTTVANVLGRHGAVTMLGDLRLPDELSAALHRAEHAVVAAVVRSGESLGLARRWQDMGIAHGLLERASLAVVTLRRLPRASPRTDAPDDILVVEVLEPGGVLRTSSLVEEVRALVATGLVTEEAARFNVPDYA
ncbi:hypothetical protein AKJ09_08958 [Labilithrix luteola]|uniref:Uncharacterized protein n=1 Tax=Labilithrix luteola TaxID=1391654 RepID=A0A0K1QA65_9BACT|nr:hypothetical protein [Labilithrix luteola]AKV02295.1 hypothetical protein AKJ09_08958 [Labilithrix luteola]